jgi:protein gp37
MAENSSIEWTDHTFNPWRGCAKVHAGCAHCYAEREGAGAPLFFTQWAGLFPEKNGVVYRNVGKRNAGRLLDGREWNEYPQRIEANPCH